MKKQSNMKTILRIIVGIIFIVSGGVKAVDPVGFSFKLEEYFSPSVFNLPWLENFALPLSLFVVAFEIVLGVMLLLNIRIRKVLGWLIALCVFFAFLTFYSAYYNKVTDCGCFGDAIKFTPWQSFYKDIVLLFALVILAIAYRKTSQNWVSPLSKIAFALSIVLMTTIMVWGIVSEPIIDFRDYKIGTNLWEERQKIAQDPDVYKNFYVLKHKKTQEEKSISQDDFLATPAYWEEDSPWEILSEKTYSEKVHSGYASEIKKFRLEDFVGNDITEQVLNAPKAVLLFSYAPKSLSDEERKKAQEAVKNNDFVVGVSIEPNVFPMLKQAVMDATAIKTIARSNPFVLVLEKGKIVEKRSL